MRFLIQLNIYDVWLGIKQEDNIFFFPWLVSSQAWGYEIKSSQPFDYHLLLRWLYQ